MNFKKQRPGKRIRVSLEDKVAHLLQNKAQSHQVKFIFKDGTSITQELRNSFMYKKRASMLIADIKAIHHDLGAKYFVI